MDWGTFTDATMKLLENSMTFRTRNQETIAANIANLDTPHYTGKQMDFQKVLDGYTQGVQPVSLTKTNTLHLGAGKSGMAGLAEDTGEAVDLDREMVRMSINQLGYQSSVQMLNKKLEQLRNAIDGGSK
jgi:flagellar basal-body rod protein FlgB